MTPPDKRSGQGQHETAGVPKRRQLAFGDRCLADLRHWVQTDPRVAGRILKLVEETLRDPFRGTGEPEPLKGAGGTWSRRITDEHRLTYRVTDQEVFLMSARFHYDK